MHEKQLATHLQRQMRDFGDVRRPDPIEVQQLRRLANAVVAKSRADLAALAENNPALVWEWIEAFRRQKLAADAESRYWSNAVRELSAACPRAVGAAAE